VTPEDCGVALDVECVDDVDHVHRVVPDCTAHHIAEQVAE